MPAADVPPQAWNVASGEVRATLEQRQGALRLVVAHDGRTVLTATLGPAPRRRAEISRGRVDQTFTTPSGKRHEHHLTARRLTVRLGRTTVKILAADDGVAFKTSGATTFRLPPNTRTWLQDYRTDYETPYVERRVAGKRYGLPALLRRDDTYALLTESGVGRGPVSHLEGLRLTPDSGLWRVAVVGSLAEVVESDLPLALGRPSKIKDTSWIEPGVSAWSWWADRGSGASLDAQKASVDTAAANGWEYVTVDAGWDPAWIPELVSYATERGVKVILWYDVDDADLDQAADLGAAGVKLDFVLSDRRTGIARMNDLARVAAKRHLVVDFHGCTIPRGLQRTWPNVLALEAVRGAEYWTHEPASPAHNVNLAFTRNVVGGMDYTPVTFSAPGRVTSLGHELAESVVFESGLQHFADAPAAYAAEPIAARILRAVPADWDDTRLVSGAPDDHVVIARRDGGTWWVGGLTAGPARTVDVALDFLDPGDHLARIVVDGLTETTRFVSPQTVLDLPVAENGGFVIELDRMSLVSVLLTAVALTTYGPDRAHYDVAVAHTAHRLKGTETITFHNPFATPLDHVWVREWDKAYGPCERCTKRRLVLDPPVAPGGTGSVTVPVDAKVPDTYDRFGSLGRIDVFGNALPILAVSVDGAEPRLPPYTFLGESFFSLTASWTVRLELRPGERVAATGTQTARDGDTVTLEAPAERDFMLVAGPMDVEQTTRDGIRVRWFTPKGAPRSTGLDQAADSLAALQDRLGDYGAEEFDGVETPVLGESNGVAMEYPQLILSPASKPAVSHEVAHQWFYRLIGNDEWRDPWVDETLASFATIRLGAALNGPNSLKDCDTRDRPVRPPVPVDSGMRRLSRRFKRDPTVISRTLYREGPCALFKLQRRIGEPAMDAFLAGLVTRFRGGVLTSEQLRDEIAALPGGRAALRDMKI